MGNFSSPLLHLLYCHSQNINPNTEPCWQGEGKYLYCNGLNECFLNAILSETFRERYYTNSMIWRFSEEMDDNFREKCLGQNEMRRVEIKWKGLFWVTHIIKKLREKQEKDLSSGCFLQCMKMWFICAHFIFFLAASWFAFLFLNEINYLICK